MRQTSLLHMPRDLELMGTWTTRHELQLAAVATEGLERFGVLQVGAAGGCGPMLNDTRMDRRLMRSVDSRVDSQDGV